MAEEITMGGGSSVPGSKLDPGTYNLELVDVKTRQMRRGEQFCKPENGEHPDDMVPKLEWHFKELASGDVITMLTSMSTGEKSAFIRTVGPALNYGTLPCAPGDPFKPASLIGRTCLGAVTQNTRGWAKLTNLMPLPKSAAPKADAKAAPPTPAEDAPDVADLDETPF